MNALHQAVISSQLRRYSDCLEVFLKEIENDDRISDGERQEISEAVSSASYKLKSLSDALHNNH